MKSEEIQRKSKFTPVIGLCEICEYIHQCDKILVGFNKPDDCDGPYIND